MCQKLSLRPYRIKQSSIAAHCLQVVPTPNTHGLIGSRVCTAFYLKQLRDMIFTSALAAKTNTGFLGLSREHGNMLCRDYEGIASSYPKPQSLSHIMFPYSLLRTRKLVGRHKATLKALQSNPEIGSHSDPVT